MIITISSSSLSSPLSLSVLACHQLRVKGNEERRQTISSSFSQRNLPILLSNSLILRELTSFLLTGAFTSGRIKERGIPSKWVNERLRFFPSSSKVASVLTSALIHIIGSGRTSSVAGGVGGVEFTKPLEPEELDRPELLRRVVRSSESRCWTTKTKYCLDWILSSTTSSWTVVLGVDHIMIRSDETNGQGQSIRFPSFKSFSQDMSINTRSCLHSTIHSTPFLRMSVMSTCILCPSRLIV